VGTRLTEAVAEVPVVVVTVTRVEGAAVVDRLPVGIMVLNELGGALVVARDEVEAAEVVLMRMVLEVA
jgi:hypothetical protein